MHETFDRDILAFAPEAHLAAAVGPRLGIVGGGQLARMTAMAALQLGCDVIVLERNRYSPAATLATHSMVGDWDDVASLLALAERADVITLENEFVDAAALAALEARGHTVRPGARTIALVQDKFTQKQALQAAGLPVPRLAAVATPDEAARAAGGFGWPALLKARRNGYDGKGNATVRAPADIPRAWAQLGGMAGQALFVEAFCDFAMELAVIVTRGRDGHMVTYPVVETVQRDHVCRVVRAPAAVTDEVAARAAEVARRAVEAVDAVGSFGVELFLTRTGEIVVNELAPRVHNSGHYTIEASECSQFENHVRAVLGLPLGSPRMVAPAAVMVNLFGTDRAPGRPTGLGVALEVPGAHVHLYGKAMSGPRRKMGHVTALGASVPEAEATAARAAACIRFGGTA